MSEDPPSNSKETNQNTEDIDFSSKKFSNKKNNFNNNFYSYNPPPIPTKETKKTEKASNIQNPTKNNSKKEKIEPKETDLKDIVFDEDIEEIDETNSFDENNILFDRRKPRKKQRHEEIEVIESDEDEENNNEKNIGNEIEISFDNLDQKINQILPKNLEKIVNKKDIEKKVEKLKKKKTDEETPKQEIKKEEKKEEERFIERIPRRNREDPDEIVQNFEKEIMKKIRNSKYNEPNKNNINNNNKQNDKKPAKLEDRLNIEDSEGLSKEETVIQYLIQSLDTSNISNLLSKLAPQDNKKKYARKNKKSLFQVTDANGKRIKNMPNSPQSDDPNQPKPKKLTKKEREKDPNVINQKNIFNSILLTSLMKQYGYDAIAEAIVKTKNTEEEYEKNDLDEFIECILKTTTYNSLIHSLIQCKAEADAENEVKKSDDPEGLDAQINNYLNYKIKERQEKTEQTKDIDIIVAPDAKRDKSEESVQLGRRKRRRKEKNENEENDEDIVLLNNERQSYSLRNPQKIPQNNDNDIDIEVEQDDNNDDESYEINIEGNSQKTEGQQLPYQLIRQKIVNENQKILKEKKFGMHYNLGRDGHIYKYYHQHLKDGDKVVYECSDPVCKSKGIYYMNEKRFEVVSNHVGYWLHSVLLRTSRKDKFIALMQNKGYKDMHLSRANGTSIEWAS